MRTVIAAVAACLLLSGCGTRYQDMGFTGGVAADQMSADVFRIRARGNGFTDPTVVKDYVLLKAAETTKAAGGTHFQLISAQDASTMGSISTPGTMNTSVYGNMAYSTYTPATETTYVRPGSDAYIRVIRLQAGVAAPRGLFAAEEIIRFVGSRVRRPQ